MKKLSFSPLPLKKRPRTQHRPNAFPTVTEPGTLNSPCSINLNYGNKAIKVFTNCYVECIMRETLSQTLPVLITAYTTRDRNLSKVNFIMRLKYICFPSYTLHTDFIWTIREDYRSGMNYLECRLIRYKIYINGPPVQERSFNMYICIHMVAEVWLGVKKCMII